MSLVKIYTSLMKFILIQITKFIGWCDNIINVFGLN
jgi:hypothetical protein